MGPIVRDVKRSVSLELKTAMVLVVTPKRRAIVMVQPDHELGNALMNRVPNFLIRRELDVQKRARRLTMTTIQDVLLIHPFSSFKELVLPNKTELLVRTDKNHGELTRGT